MSVRHTVEHLGPTLPVHRFQSDKDGPTAIIQAGIHGDEIAGVYAIEELLEAELRPKRGTLILIPRMNPPAIRARERAAPGGLDLNRCFPGSAEASAVEHRLAHRFMTLCQQEKPALVATLHESWKRHHPDLPVSFGQSVVYGVQPMPPIVAEVVSAMNRTLEQPYERWAPHHFPVPTSSTEVIVEAIGCVGLCIETWMGFTLHRRIAMQRAVVKHLLRQINLIGTDLTPY